MSTEPRDLTAELLTALRPFADASARIPATWKADKELRRQSNISGLPTVGDYRKLAEVLAAIRKVMEKV